MGRSVSIEPFLQFADLMAEAMILVSGTGVILAANRGVANRLGISPGRLRGKRLADVTTSAPDLVAAYLRACARTREMMPSAFTLVRTDGTTLACRTEGAVLRPRSEDTEALIVLRLIPRQTETQFTALSQKIAELDREIQQRVRVEKELREQREWLGVTLASIGDAVIVTDTAGGVMFMNPVAETLTGWTQEEALGQPLDQVFTLIDEKTRQPVESPVARVLRAEGIVGLPPQSLLIARHGAEIAIDDSAAPIGRNGDSIRGIVLVFHNIEERRRLERELRQRAEELTRADRQKNEFLAMLAHELRNPLAPIDSALEVLRQGNSEEHEREADLDRAIEIMSRQVRHMARLVDDLLDVSRITRGKIVLRRALVAPQVIAAHAVESVQPLITARRHELLVMLPPSEPAVLLNADPARLEQVLCNLLNNAAKYTKEGGRIRLSAAVEDEGRSLAFRVSDNGIGIAPDVLPSVFELFRQADRSLDRAEGGLGIGLTLVRTLVALHEGTVEAHSAGIGQGSEFVVRLPLSPWERVPEGRVRADATQPLSPWERVPEGRVRADATPSAVASEGPVRASAPPGAAAPARRRRVLVVDDSTDSAESLARLLRRWGHEVHLAYDGSSALAAARATAPEVVLLDIGLPGMDGYEVARRLRQDPDHEDIVLIALTGYGQANDRRQTHDAGFDQHLIKPVDPSFLRTLLATIERRPG
jgi:PAS domain S-box-containing protein